jgi:hypothetical protein
MTLPIDVSRCSGVGDDVEGWREGCETCQRRTDRPAYAQTVRWMTPEPVIAFECPWMIEPGERA